MDRGHITVKLHKQYCTQDLVFLRLLHFLCLRIKNYASKNKQGVNKYGASDPLLYH